MTQEKKALSPWIEVVNNKYTKDHSVRLVANGILGDFSDVMAMVGYDDLIPYVRIKEKLLAGQVQRTLQEAKDFCDKILD